MDKYRVRLSLPPSPSLRAFLKNHVKDLVSIDFFIVPTVGFKVLFVLVVLSHHQRRIVHFNVTENPTPEWTKQQIVEAFPYETTLKHLLRDLDKVYGDYFQKRVYRMGIEEVIIAPRSPWQNPYAERVIGSIHMECLDNIIVLNKRHLKERSPDISIIITGGAPTYHSTWTRLSIDPFSLLNSVRFFDFSDIGRLLQHYERRAS